MNSAYVVENIIPMIDQFRCNDAELRNQQVTLHFDNATIRNTTKVTDEMSIWGVGRIDHPAHRPDHAHCRLFLFGYLKQKLAGKQFSSRDEPICQIREWISEIPKQAFEDMFIGWQGRLRTCSDMGWIYIE
jgi:hypothetical protein